MSEEIKTHKDLKVWQETMKLTFSQLCCVMHRITKRGSNNACDTTWQRNRGYLDLLANIRGSNRSALVREAILQYLEDNEDLDLLKKAQSQTRDSKSLKQLRRELGLDSWSKRRCRTSIEKTGSTGSTRILGWLNDRIEGCKNPRHYGEPSRGDRGPDSGGIELETTEHCATFRIRKWLYWFLP